MLVPFVNSLVVLDADGDRLLAKYYDKRSKAEQTKMEQFLHKKTKAVRFDKLLCPVHVFPLASDQSLNRLQLEMRQKFSSWTLRSLFSRVVTTVGSTSAVLSMRYYVLI